MAPDIKAALKEAKVGIKDSNFEHTLKYCKIVLKHERNNYQALVLFARACQELKKFEDSKKALLLASTVEPDTVVAWQGLATLIDAQPTLSTPQEAVVVFTKLVTLVDSGPKHVSFLRKLAAAQETAGDGLAATDTLLRLLPLVRGEDKHADREIAQKIVNLLAPLQLTLSQERTNHLLTTLESLLNDSVLGNNEVNYKLYLSLVHKSGDATGLLKAASNMYGIFRTVYPLEWIARVFVETHVPWTTKDKSAISWEDCRSFITQLLERYPATLWGNLAIGLRYQEAGELPSALSAYTKACEQSNSSFSNCEGQPIIWWRLQLEAQKATKDWPALEASVGRVLTKLTNDGAKWPGMEEERKTIKDVTNSLQHLRAEALMQMGHEQHYSTAMSILRNLGSDASGLVVRCLLQFDLPAAREELRSLRENNDNPEYELLYARLLYSEQDLAGAKEALDKLLRSDNSNAEALTWLGRIHQETGNDAASLTCLLRAAKIDSSQGASFLYLGHHYRRAGDKIKACKCYQKAYALCSGEAEGAALSDIYRDIGDHEKNLALLSSATRSSCSGGAWAWLRLGLHHLSLHEPQLAISSLQRCLQLHHNHRQALESLGDAYLARGSYVAAQKVHERVLLLDPSAVYPRCQIARIQLCVGEPLIAVAQFEAVLQQCSEDNMRSVSLLGLAQAHYVLACTNATTLHHDNTLSHCVLAIKALDEARELQPNSVSVWKSLGDACSLLHRLPRYLAAAGICVPARLVKANCEATATTHVSLTSVLQLATKCYCAALQINGEEPSLWHDLGLSCYLQGRYQFQQEQTERASDGVISLLRRSSNCLKKSLKLSPLSSESWNTLGIVSVHTAAQNLPLAQHCFVRSVQLKPSSSNWTHLGAFYLVCGKTTLAHQAFSQAQALDPRFVTCWTGQALVAESVQHYDAADLFRHCCTLGVQPESCMGHAHHVLLALQDKASTSKPAPSVLSLAADSMLFYSREYDDDALGLNIAGLCLEEFGMKHTAADLYSSALTVLTQYQSGDGDRMLLDCVRGNYGRVLTSLGRVQEAAQHLSSISEPDFQTECIFALACLKGEDFENGYAKYQSALHWLAQNHHHKANVLVALACLQYKFKKVLDAKTLLFESCKEGGGCVAGILALGALGLMQGDETLITAALNELERHKHEPEAAHHVAFLAAAQMIARGQLTEAKNILSRALLCRPQSAELWRFLSWHLLSSSNTTAQRKTAASSGPRTGGRRHAAAGAGRGDARQADRVSRGIVACASAATTLSQASGGGSGGAGVKCHSPSTQDGSVRVLGYLQAGGKHQALKEAQRCLLMHPAEPHAWATLVAAASATQDERLGGRVSSIRSVWADKCSPAVQTWMNNIVPVVA